MAAEETILSIVLSTSELATIDLSNIQLFQADGPHFAHPLFSGAEGHEGIRIGRVHGPANINREKPVVLKSKGVMDAERSMLEQHERRKSVSMDETDFKGLEPEKPMTRDDSAVGKSRSTRDRPAAMPMFARNRGMAASIDLKSSPDAKLVVQVMPWELQPSPITPYTPAAVPFKWEEAPGKPKSPLLQHPHHALAAAKASAFVSTKPANSGGHSGELLMAHRCQNPKDGRSLNARIAAAMDLKLYDDTTRIVAPPIPSPPPVYDAKAPDKKKTRRRKWIVRKLRRPSRFFRAFFKAVWRAVSGRSSARHGRRGSLKLSYQSLSGPDVL